MDDSSLQTLGTMSMSNIADTLTQGVQELVQCQRSDDSSEFNSSLTASLQELSLRLSQLTANGGHAGKDHEERRALAQKSRKMLQEASVKFQEGKTAPALTQSLQGCVIALRAAEHASAQQVVAAGEPVLQTLGILERSSVSKQIFLNMKLLGMRLTKFLELCGRRVHDLKGPKRQSKVQANVYAISRLFPSLIHTLENTLSRPNSACDRASKDIMFSLVRWAVKAIVHDFTTTDTDESQINSDVGRFVTTVDSILEDVDKVKTTADFDKVQGNVQWLVSFCLSVSKVSCNSQDEKDIAIACKHVVCEMETLKSSLAGDSIADIALAKEVVKDFIEVTEQSVNTALLRLIVSVFSQLHPPLDNLVHEVLSANKKLENRKQEDISVDLMDEHADRLFHIAQFATFCTSDVKASQAIANSFHLAQLVEKELVPASMSLYVNPGDIGARTHLKTLRTLWKTEMNCLESYVLEIVDHTAFCVIADAVARKIASSVKTDLYSQDRDWLRLSVSRIVKLCQTSVDFAWKEVITASTSQSNQQLPEDHPIIRVERSSWEATAALKMVMLNIEDLGAHKVMIRRVQLMVTCMSAMVECLVDANKTENLQTKSQVRVLTSVSRTTIGPTEDSLENGAYDTKTETDAKRTTRILGKSFKNITINNSRVSKLTRQVDTVKLFDIPFNGSLAPDEKKNTESQEADISKSEKALKNVPDTKPKPPIRDEENPEVKDVYRKVKVHSSSSGVRSPLKQINNQLNSVGIK